MYPEEDEYLLGLVRGRLAYRSTSDARVLIEDDTLDGAEVLPDFRLPMSGLFRWLGKSGQA